MGIGRDLGKKLLERASSKVSDTLSRADVLGGKLRDRVTEKLESLKTPPRVVHSVTPSVARAAAPKASPSLGDPSRAAQVFGRSSCPWSGRAVALLESSQIEHTYFELDSYGGEEVLRDLKLETKQDTVPFVFVRGRFVGGYNALDELYRLGQLEYLCLSDTERVKHPLHGRIEVAPRSHDGERFEGA
jgi:glutaredoxin